MIRKEIIVDGNRKLSYLEWGGGDNVLICVHGLLSNALDFSHFAPNISNKYRVIAIDVAGRGASDKLADPAQYGYSLYIADVLYLLKALNITTQVTWLGCSMGGIMGILMHALRPKLISRLILNDIGPQIPDDALSIITNKLPKIYNKELYSCKEYANIDNPSLFKKVDNGYAPLFDIKILETISKDVNVDTASVARAWSLVRNPVLLLWGKYSNFVNTAVVQHMQIDHDVTVCQVKYCGHVCNLDDKQVNIMLEWLEGNIKKRDIVLW